MLLIQMLLIQMLLIQMFGNSPTMFLYNTTQHLNMQGGWRCLIGCSNTAHLKRVNMLLYDFNVVLQDIARIDCCDPGWNLRS